MTADERYQQEVIDAYHRVFDNPYGEIVLKDLAKSCYLSKTTFVPGDPYATMVNEGMRTVVSSIIALLDRPITQEEPEHGTYTDNSHESRDPSDNDDLHLYYPTGGSA